MIIVFDTETTGLIPGDDEVIQFSAIDEDGNVLMNEYIRPSRHTSFTEASEVNGIYYDDLKDKPLFSHYHDQIQELFDQADTLVTYNGEFDINMLKGEGIRFKRHYKHYDVMKLFAPRFMVNTTENMAHTSGKRFPHARTTSNTNLKLTIPWKM